MYKLVLLEDTVDYPVTMVYSKMYLCLGGRLISQLGR